MIWCPVVGPPKECPGKLYCDQHGCAHKPARAPSEEALAEAEDMLRHFSHEWDKQAGIVAVAARIDTFTQRLSAAPALEDALIGGTHLCGHGSMAVMCRICPVERERDEARAEVKRLSAALLDPSDEVAEAVIYAFSQWAILPSPQNRIGMVRAALRVAAMKIKETA